MKQILVPTDFSKIAGNAIDFAVETSKIFPSKITLLHSYESGGSLYTDYMGVNKEFRHAMMNDVKNQLEEIKANIREKDGVVVDTIVSNESFDEAMKLFASPGKTELIVMGTLGAGGLKEKLIGSRTASEIGRAKVPLMVVPHNYKWKKPQKILFATNNFEKDPVILDAIFELAGLYMANVQVTIFTDEEDIKANIYQDNEKKIAEYRDFLRTTYSEDTLTSAHLYGDNFEESLQDFIKDNDIDILVMVTYQPNFWNRIFSPSKTKRMSYHTRIPLLAIPAPKGRK